ncbi:response regulator [Methanolapillus ohkumae]|uniref:Polar-differentiation response regulator DivK n=1 Tax=Methanolapillus ohkumae TaxID=3028298 RepID=A0AA96V5T1_9EURY|nr:Polar-differentiation response regulator DivK [Methanosarcinaceae archaeon Am2]
MKKILLVEDNSMNRELIKDVLETFQFKVVCAEDGFEALLFVEKSEFDLVLVDLNLPKMSGVEFALKIKAGSYKCGKLIALTANEYSEVSDKIQGAFDGYIHKPFQINDFRNKIYELIQ